MHTIWHQFEGSGFAHPEYVHKVDAVRVSLVVRRSYWTARLVHRWWNQGAGGGGICPHKNCLVGEKSATVTDGLHSNLVHAQRENAGLNHS